MNNRISKLILLTLMIAAVAYAMAPTASTVVRGEGVISARAVANNPTKKRVTFHYSHVPGPLVQALIEETANSTVVVQRQHFTHKGATGVPFDRARNYEKAAFRADLGVEETEDEDLHGWIFRRAKLMEKLLELKPIFEAEWDDNNPQFSTLMLDIEPHYEDPGASRIAMMNDALGLCHTVLGSKVQVGIQGLPHQRGLNQKGAIPVRMYDSVITNQGAIFIHPRFSKRGNNWFEAGMRLTQALLDRVEPIRDSRPVIAFIWTRHSTEHWLIPDDQILQQIRLLAAANVEISIFSAIDAETAHVIELVRSVLLEEQTP